jgi:hypothetical protein
MTTDGLIPLTGFEGIDRVIKEINEFEKSIPPGLLDHEENLAGFNRILEKIETPKQK